MTIKAVVRDGRIQPLEPLPPDWSDGKELVVEEPDLSANEARIDEWERELAAATAELPAEEHERFRKAINDIECDSKESVRREWRLP